MLTYVWLALMVVFLVVEANAVALVSLWFAAGALAALIASLFSVPVGLQIALFLIVSGGLLACLRPVVRKYIHPKITKTNVDALIGSRCYVTASIDNLSAQGQVKLGAMYWTARSTDGIGIPEGTLVQVDKIEGVKVFVSPAEITEKL